MEQSYLDDSCGNDCEAVPQRIEYCPQVFCESPIGARQLLRYFDELLDEDADVFRSRHHETTAAGANTSRNFELTSIANLPVMARFAIRDTLHLSRTITKKHEYSSYELVVSSNLLRANTDETFSEKIYTLETYGDDIAFATVTERNIVPEAAYSSEDERARLVDRDMGIYDARSVLALCDSIQSVQNVRG